MFREYIAIMGKPGDADSGFLEAVKNELEQLRKLHFDLEQAFSTTDKERVEFIDKHATELEWRKKLQSELADTQKKLAVEKEKNAQLETTKKNLTSELATTQQQKKDRMVKVMTKWKGQTDYEMKASCFEWWLRDAKVEKYERQLSGGDQVIKQLHLEKAKVIEANQKLQTELEETKTALKIEEEKLAASIDRANEVGRQIFVKFKQENF